MNMLNSISLAVGPKRRRTSLCILLPALFLLSAAFFIASAFLITQDYKQRISRWRMLGAVSFTRSMICHQTQCTPNPNGSQALPKGIISRTSNLEMRPLWGPPNIKRNTKMSMSLLAIAVGIKQKENVKKIIMKFPMDNFVVMLFHYDGIVDDWRDLEWNDRAVHVSAINQTKWWFAKRFLHPDIVSEYAYIFLWDEDIGVENFHVERYISIVKEEGLEISQPGLDTDNSEIHHLITARESTATVHRRVDMLRGGGRRCDENSTDPPCTGWVEMMAPVFSRASWRCTWHMIQNDLVHAWGLDFQLGYCAQGDRTKNIGIVDSEYIVHYGLPTLGGLAENKTNEEAAASDLTLPNANQSALSVPSQPSGRHAVRRQSFIELEIFKNRWKKAVREDEYWTDPYEKQT